MHRPVKGTIRQATISRTPTGKYFVSILAETGEAVKPKKVVREQTTVGIDLGIKSFLALSDGQQIDSPSFLKKQLESCVSSRADIPGIKAKKKTPPGSTA